MGCAGGGARDAALLDGPAHGDAGALRHRRRPLPAHTDPLPGRLRERERDRETERESVCVCVEHTDPLLGP